MKEEFSRSPRKTFTERFARIHPKNISASINIFRGHHTNFGERFVYITECSVKMRESSHTHVTGQNGNDLLIESQKGIINEQTNMIARWQKRCKEAEAELEAEREAHEQSKMELIFLKEMIERISVCNGKLLAEVAELEEKVVEEETKKPNWFDQFRAKSI